MNYIVISDLHIGADTELDIFSSHAELSGFLKSLGDEPQTLIINGDFIDFLTIEPPEFSRNTAVKKVTRVIQTPGNQPLWKGFREFLKLNNSNQIDVMLGNHDVELAFKDVQEALQSVMAEKAESERVQFITDRVSHQKVKVGEVPIHVEHGFQFDPYNWYDQDKLTAATLFKDSKATFDLPVGTRLVYETLNKLTPNHPYLPLLKPETAGVYILLAIAPKEVGSQLSAFTGLFGGKYFNKLKMRLRGQQFANPAPVDLARGSSAIEPQITNMLLDGKMDAALLNDLQEFIARGDPQRTSSSSVSFGIGSKIKNVGRNISHYLLRKGLAGLKEQRDTFFDAEARDEFRPALEKILDLGAKVAILGHSHSRKVLDLKGPDSARSLLYLNTGTWANMLDFDLSLLASDDALSKWLDDLEHRKFKPVLQLTFVRLRELRSGKGVRVSLEEWTGGKTKEVEPARVVSIEKPS